MAEKAKKTQGKLYIIGQIKGLSEAVAKQKFKDAADDYKHDFGANIVNPMELPSGDNKVKTMIQELTQCDHVLIIGDYLMDEEQQLLVQIAHACSMHMLYQ